MTTTRRRSRWSHKVEDAIADLAARDMSASAIREELHNRLHFEWKEIPSERAIDDRLQKLRPRDPADPWRLADGAGHTASLVLPVLAALIEETGGRKTSLTRLEASWIVRVRRARPDLLPWWAYRFARAYVAADLANDDVALAVLDAQLALAPAQEPLDASAERALTRLRYEAALERGIVGAASFLIWPESWQWVEKQGKEDDDDKTR